jgi:hypothetical protein
VRSFFFAYHGWKEQLNKEEISRMKVYSSIQFLI